MQLGMIGLGRMGANMVRRLQKNGHTCVVFDRTAETVKQLASEGATGATSLDDFIQKLQKPRAIRSAHRWQGPEAQALFAGVAAHAFRPFSAPMSSAIGVTLGTAAHRYGWPVAEGPSSPPPCARAPPSNRARNRSPADRSPWSRVC